MTAVLVLMAMALTGAAEVTAAPLTVAAGAAPLSEASLSKRLLAAKATPAGMPAVHAVPSNDPEAEFGGVADLCALKMPRGLYAAAVTGAATEDKMTMASAFSFRTARDVANAATSWRKARCKGDHVVKATLKGMPKGAVALRLQSGRQVVGYAAVVPVGRNVVTHIVAGSPDSPAAEFAAATRRLTRAVGPA
ncbi:hypothetical protein [Motilibacter aurantiacus]|uniref:hypothetical protein n=1 Tax=Motilibacter aurantiacus TaxID=2714955 RepID=UPI001409868C|nr:hypothetical protein [Motilibacter aurantiacus]NHC47629.1 hypothetical protein [Motilibacter aurantiacus]